MEENNVEEEVKEVRHTISAEETFTLAKDVYDLRCVIKKIYNNRAQISRRLNLLSLIFSIGFTLLYVAYMLFGGIIKKLSLGWEVAVYCIVGAYGVLIIILAVLMITGQNNTTKTQKRRGKILKLFRYLIRIASLLMGITATIISVMSGAEDAVGIALDTIAIIISVVFVIFSAIPLICGGIGGLARWLLSPARIKRKFSFVVIEWYQLLTSDKRALNKSTQKVSDKYFDDIGRCVDSILLPALGKKYMTAITINDIYSAIGRADEEDKSVVEGIIKNVFDYSTECGYVSIDPCKDMNLEGSIEIAEKAKKESIKTKIGKKVGMTVLNKILGKGDKNDDKN
jgi:hypothetical protein